MKSLIFSNVEFVGHDLGWVMKHLDGTTARYHLPPLAFIADSASSLRDRMGEKQAGLGHRLRISICRTHLPVKPYAILQYSIQTPHFTMKEPQTHNPLTRKYSSLVSDPCEQVLGGIFGSEKKKSSWKYFWFLFLFWFSGHTQL